MYPTSRQPAFHLLIALFLQFTASTAQVCGPGTFKTPTGCTDCPVGTYQWQSDQPSCIPCEPGTFNPIKGAPGPDFCRRCPIDTFSNATGASTCIPCQTGTVSRLASTRCLACGPGQFIAQVGCANCPYNTYSDQPVNRECTRCPFRMRSLRRSDSLSDCKRCPKGRQLRSNNRANCVDCISSTFNDGSLPFCISCPRGFFADGPRATRCQPCPAGTFAGGGGVLSCRACSPGRETKGTGNTLCRIAGAACPPNYFIDAFGDCRQCRPGQFLDEKQKKCLDCPANSVNKIGIATSCTRCPRGQITNDLRDECVCPDGRFMLLNGKCRKCPRGTFKSDSGSSVPLKKCTPCRPGTFANKPGTVECSPCPPGRTQPDSGSRRCVRCPPGFKVREDRGTSFFSNTQARPCVSVRTNCPAGATRVTSFGFLRGCKIECPEDKVAIDARCTTCAAGEFYDDDDGVCKACPRDSFNLPGVSRSCKRCPGGQDRDRDDGSKCRCRSGFGIRPPRTDRCFICRRGFFAGQTRLGSELECLPCPAGLRSNTNGVSGCSPCLAGFFTNTTGTIECKRCPEGTVSYGRGETECLPLSTSSTV